MGLHLCNYIIVFLLNCYIFLPLQLEQLVEFHVQPQSLLLLLPFLSVHVFERSSNSTVASGLQYTLECLPGWLQLQKYEHCRDHEVHPYIVLKIEDTVGQLLFKDE